MFLRVIVFPLKILPLSVLFKKTKTKQQIGIQLFVEMMEFFVKMINIFKLLIIFLEGFALEVFAYGPEGDY